MKGKDIYMIINKIQNTHFSESEEVILRYILSQSEAIEPMTIQDIANATYTSAPLLVRISKKLGYKGWSDFKKAFLEELHYMFQSQDIDATIPFVEDDDTVTIANNILTLHSETAEDTRKLLKHDELNKAITLLNEAEVIDVYAKACYEYTGRLFQNKMHTINKNVLMMSDPILQAAMSNEKHAAIVVSYSGETSRMVKVAHMLKERHTPIVAITSISQSELSHLADAILHISSREMLNTKIADFASTESINCLFDILYAGIFAKDYNKNLDYKMTIAENIDDNFSEYAFIDEDNSKL